MTTKLRTFMSAMRMLSTYSLSFLLVWSYILLASSSLMALTDWRSAMDTMLNHKDSTAICSQHFAHPWVFALTIVHGKERLLWSRSRALLVYTHRKHSKNSSICPFSKNISSRFSLVSDFQSHGSMTRAMAPAMNSLVQVKPQVLWEINRLLL